VERAERMLKGWSEDQTRDIADEMWRLTSAIAVRTLFGTDELQDEDTFGEALYAAVHLIGLRFRRLFQFPNWVPTPNNLRLKRAMRYLHRIADGFIRQGRASKEPGDNLLSLLLYAQDDDGSRMTDEQLRAEILTLFLAGHETTANALTWTWYLLSQNPDCELKFQGEVDSVLKGRLPAFEDVARLRYTENAIAESLRLYPPAWAMGRYGQNDFALGDYFLPAGTTVLISQFITHRDPRYFPEPLRFDPDRFSGEAKARRTKFTYFPFGAGARQCIGESFAWMEGVLILATLGQKWKLRLVPGHRVEPQPLITLRPKYGMRMLVEPR